MACYQLFSTLFQQHAYWKLDGQLKASLSLMFLKIDLLKFHPLLEICSCERMRSKKYCTTKKLFDTLLKRVCKNLSEFLGVRQNRKRKNWETKSPPHVKGTGQTWEIAPANLRKVARFYSFYVL